MQCKPEQQTRPLTAGKTGNPATNTLTNHPPPPPPPQKKKIYKAPLFFVKFRWAELA